jgi:hypothetical protein
MRLPLSPVTPLVQRQVLINSYAFSIILASDDIAVASEFQYAVEEYRKLFPSAVQLGPGVDRSKLLCTWDHAAQSIEQLHSEFPIRFGYESNDHTKRLLRNQRGATILALTRVLIEERDVRSASEALKQLIRNREMAFAHQMRVGLMVDGFDDDPRELWEISEVRNYIRQLFVECPFIMLFAHPQLNLVKLFCACWIFEPGEESDVAMKARELDFLRRCFQANNDVSYRLLISPEFKQQAEASAMHSLYSDQPEHGSYNCET